MPKKKEGWKIFCKEHSLTLILLLILFSQMIGYWFLGIEEWRSDQITNNAPTNIWPDYVIYYWSQIWVNLLADTYGALLIVFLTKYFYERKSAESN